MTRVEIVAYFEAVVRGSDTEAGGRGGQLREALARAGLSWARRCAAGHQMPTRRTPEADTADTGD